MKNFLVIINGKDFKNGVQNQDKAQTIFIEQTSIEEVFNYLKETHNNLNMLTKELEDVEDRNVHFHEAQIADRVWIFTATHYAKKGKNVALGLNTILILEQELIGRPSEYLSSLYQTDPPSTEGFATN